MRILTTVLALGALIAVPAAYAQEDMMFTVADADANGQVSMEEATAAIPDITEEDFTAADADQSGALNEDELATLGAGGSMEEEGATEEKGTTQ